MMLLAGLLVAIGTSCSDNNSKASEPALTGPAAAGRQVAQSHGCTACHSVDGKALVGPSWKGLAGSQVELNNGTKVTADRAYLDESITDPNAKVVKGFNAIMPKVDLSADDRAKIIAYLEAIGSGGS
jgi:cytochrome c oxidase subunit 2